MADKEYRFKLSETAKELFKPKRYKVLYGGRGGCKSHDIAGTLVLMGADRKLLIVCAREVQKSISQSVHRLIKNKIESDPVLCDFYEVQDKKIIGKNGTEIHFIGLKHNVDSVRSYEGCDICWVEEASNVSDNSWEVLIPTMREEDKEKGTFSEIWISFNPRYPTDPTWVRFVENADEDTFIKKVSWRDNPWFPDVLNKERIKLQKTDPKAYEHIWEGAFDERFQGCVYATQLKAAREAGRITSVPYKVGVPVNTAWDLGMSDYTSIWFWQKVGLEIRVIDFYECNQENLDHYADLIRSKPYSYGTHFLPHDSSHSRLGMKGSIKTQLKTMGIDSKMLPPLNDKAGIALGRTMIGECYIDNNNCKDGLHALNHFQYEYDEVNKIFKSKPRHDWSSHAADAWKYMCLAINNEKTLNNKPPVRARRVNLNQQGWMG